MALRSTSRLIRASSVAKTNQICRLARKPRSATGLEAAVSTSAVAKTFSRSFASASNSIPPKHLEALKDLERQVKSGEIDTVIVAFTDHIGRYMGKRYDAEFFLEEGFKGAHACEYLLTIDADQNILKGFKFANWHSGYGDVHLKPDLNTLRKAAWLPKTYMVLCDVIDRHTHVDATVAPRSMLLKQVERAKKLGFIAKAASELEYYMYHNSYRNMHETNYTAMKPFGWYLGDYHMLQDTRAESFNADVRRLLKQSGVAVENSKGEYGLGQHELNVKYNEILAMADNHTVYKQCLKEVAEQKGMSVTFMAKPHADQSGSSCHIHMSLWDLADKKNMFDGDGNLDGIKSSETFRHFLGGWMKYTPELMAFYAPTVNAFKRYQSASWAPTSLTWSPDNRTAGFRVVGQGKSLRIECRIPGADANPYLAFAASLAAGLAGVEQKIEPPPATVGDIYNKEVKVHMPKSLGEAARMLEHSEFAKRSFGEDVVFHYSHFYLQEQKQYDAAVTDWERRRYFEQI